MSGKRFCNPPEKLSEKVYVLVKYIRDGIYNVVEPKDIRIQDDTTPGKLCTALWKPNKMFYPAIIVKKDDDKDRLQKLKGKIIKQEKEARAQNEDFDLFKWLKTSEDHSSSKGTETPSKMTKKKQTDLPKGKLKDCTAGKRKDYVNHLMEDEDDDNDTEDQEYEEYLKRTREISRKKKAAQKKAISSAQQFRKKSMASHLTHLPTETQDTSTFKRKASHVEISSDDDDEGEVPFVGEDLASSKLERENQYLKDELIKLRQTMKAQRLQGKELPKAIPNVDGDQTETASHGVPGEYADVDAARKLNLVPLVPGTNVFLSPSKLATAGNGVSSPTILTYNLLRVFFKKETVRLSNYNGGGTSGYKALNRSITSAIIGYVKLKMPETKSSIITAAINTYCTRIRNQLKVKKEHKNE